MQNTDASRCRIAGSIIDIYFAFMGRGEGCGPTSDESLYTAIIDRVEEYDTYACIFGSENKLEMKRMAADLIGFDFSRLCLAAWHCHLAFLVRCG